MKKFERKDKDERRRVLFSEKYEKKEARIAKYGSDSVAVVAKDFNRRIIAAVLAMVFVLTTLVVGVNIFTRAEEYEEEDKPITMQVMVNGKSLMDSNEEPFTVQFPSALVSNGLIKEGIDYQKVNDNQEIVVDSIFNKVVYQIFNDDFERIEECKDKINFLGSYVITSEQEKIQITNLIISDDEIVQYLPESNEITETSLGWINAKEEDAFILSFEDDSDKPIVIEGSSKNLIIAEPEDTISVEPDGTIQEINGKMPAMVKGLFRGTALANSGLSPVDVFHVIYNDVPLDDINITLPAGDIEDNMSDPSVDEQEHNLLHPKAVWKDAVIWKWNSDSNSYTEYQIANVGKSGDEIYYSFEGNNEDTGIKLEANDKLYLKYNLTFNVSYQFTPTNGGALDGAIESVKYGHSLPVSLHPNTYYSLTSTTYNIVTGYDSDGVTPNSYKYGSAQPVVNQTIPAEDIVGDVMVYASFAEDTSYYIDANGIEHGHICAAHSMDYSNENNGNNIAEYGPTDSNSGIKHGVTVEPGGTAYLVMFAQKANNASDTYTLNAIRLNGEEVAIPTTTSFTEGNPDNVAITTLSNGSVVTISLVEDAKDNHLSSNANTIRTRYIIKIEDVKENITIQVYFRPYAEKNMYLKGLRGIANTAAAYPLPTYKCWLGRPGDDGGATIFYFWDENNGVKKFEHSYSSYGMSAFVEKVRNEQSFISSLLFLGHQISDCHIHNVYLAKAKPGYNPNSIQYTDLYCDFDGSVGNALLAQKKDVTINNSTTESGFQNSYDERDPYDYGTIFPDHYNSYYCKWNTALRSSDITTSSISASRYAILSDENQSNTTNMVNAVTSYTPFIMGAQNQFYNSGIMLPELSGANNSLQVNATAYKYKVQYLLNGQDQNGNAVSNGQIIYSNSEGNKYYSDGSNAFSEINRHAIEIVNNPASNANPNEFNNVEGNTIILPENAPVHAPSETETFMFKYWKLVKCNTVTGEYVADVYDSSNAVITRNPGETFVIDDFAVGFQTTVNRNINSNYNATYAPNAKKSSLPSSGYAWGDYNSSDENALTFTFMPVWETTPIGDYISYTVRAYKDTPDSALTDLEGNPRTVTKGEGDNAKVYYLYYENTDSKAAPGSEIVSLNQHYPTDGKRYDLNSSLSKEKINSLTTGQDDEIEYYYDVSEMDVTIDEETVAADTEAEGYLERGKEFDIVITLYKEDGTTPAEAKTYGNTPFVTENGKTTATIRMKDSDAPITIPIPYGYVLSVDETDSSRGWYADSYYDGTNSYNDAYPSITINSYQTITVRNTVSAPIIEGIFDANHHNWIIIILAVTFAIAFIGAASYIIFRKRKNALEA